MTFQLVGLLSQLDVFAAQAGHLLTQNERLAAKSLHEIQQSAGWATRE